VASFCRPPFANAHSAAFESLNSKKAPTKADAFLLAGDEGFDLTGKRKLLLPRSPVGFQAAKAHRALSFESLSPEERKSAHLPLANERSFLGWG
jgi:hypothetical protein